MTEALLDNPAIAEIEAADRPKFVPRLPNINALILSLHIMLDNDTTAELDRAQKLPERAWQLSRRAAGFAIAAYLSSKAIHVPSLGHETSE